MAFSPGHKAFILLDGVNGAGTNVSGYADNFSLGNPTDIHDTSTFGTTGAKTSIVGLRGGGAVSMSGPADTAFCTQLAQLDAAQSAGSSSATIVYGPAGSVASALKQTAETWLSDFTISTGVGGRAEYSASLQVTAAVTTATW